MPVPGYFPRRGPLHSSAGPAPRSPCESSNADQSLISQITEAATRRPSREEVDWAPTIAEFFKKDGFPTYFSGKLHLGDKPDSYPIEHGFDEMKAFAAYYPGVYTYSDTSKWFHPFSFAKPLE